MDVGKLRSMLVRHEGLRLKPYVDTVGKVTIGVGHNLTDKGISYAQAMNLCDTDINDTLEFLHSHCPWWEQLDDVRQRAIADATFDLMNKILDFHGMIGALQAQDWQAASQHLLDSLFAKQTGQRAKDLAQMLRTGQDV